MATVEKRSSKNYRVRLRPKGLPCLSLTFSTKKEAENWVFEHEQKYIEEPETYLAWLKFNRKSIKKNGLRHVHISLESIKNQQLIK